MMHSHRLKTSLVLSARRNRALDMVLARLARRRDETAAVWQEEYAAGKWDFLAAIRELTRCSVLVGYVVSLKPDASILDIGCGEGLLQRRLAPYGYRRYVGIDFAPEAVRRASRGADAVTTFLTADARTFEPDAAFDVVIFNECLYYFDDPSSMLARYAACLSPGGIFLLSNTAGISSLKVWRALDGCTIADEVVVTHASGVAWVVQVAAPHDRADGPTAQLA